MALTNCSDERNLSGQASRRGLDLHFPRYKFQNPSDQRDFQGVLLALLKQVPLSVEIEALMQHWVYFYERSIGSVGVLKDWLIRALAAALYDKSKALTLEYLQDHALSLAQCERMAIDATEGEQQLSLSESRHEQLWLLLKADGLPSQISTNADAQRLSQKTTTSTNKEPKQKRQKNSSKSLDPNQVAIKEDFNLEKPAKKKGGGRKKNQTIAQTSENSTSKTEPTIIESSSDQKINRRVAQRKPKRDSVG
ncbi:MAG: hypothetical protein QNJ72_30740 [Pleurocapsa sp. MO_226.B13]|nr:hypothetical protein [Pleurocapsa sp. MO_226.B13]